MLLKEEWLAEGRVQAFRFVRECEGDVTRIRTEIDEYKERLADPTLAVPGKPYHHGTSVRRFAEGYVPALEEALALIETHRASVE